MPEAALFLTTDFEEVEALTVLDVLRRGGVDAVSVSLTDAIWVKGSHDITVKADIMFDAFDGACDMMILPGGPGTPRYKSHEPFLNALRNHYQAGKKVAAICAAPSVLGMLGFLEGKTAVSYPSAESELKGAKLGVRPVETDGNITTSKSAATALPFALELLRQLKDDEAADAVGRQMLVSVLRDAYAENLV